MITFFNIKNYGVGMIDDCDSELLNWKWTGVPRPRNVYAKRNTRRNGKDHTLFLHRSVMERVIGRSLTKGEHVDHIDGNGLNNTRANLRLCTQGENRRNSRVRKDSGTGFKGVTYVYDTKKHYHAKVTVDGVTINLGSYFTPEEAHAAYCEAAQKYHGEFWRAA